MLANSFVFIAFALIAHVMGQKMVIRHGRPIAVTRLDPIVNPGAISGHMHTIVGGSNFASTYDPAKLVASTCTTASNPDDNSNYWTPSLYFKFNNGSYVMVNHAKQGAKTYYNNRFSDKDDTGGKVVPFPVGFSMLGGSAKSTGEVQGDKFTQAVSFACLGYPNPQTPYFPSKEKGKPKKCTTWRAQVHMPNCWDGVHATHPENKHVNYPVGRNIESGLCQPGWKRIPSIFFEFFYDLKDDIYDLSKGHFVLSNGDTEGYSFHGDFTNGWNQKKLTDIVNRCFGKANDATPCNHATENPAAKLCKLTGEYADEPTGRYNPISALKTSLNVPIKKANGVDIVPPVEAVKKPITTSKPVPTVVQSKPSVSTSTKTATQGTSTVKPVNAGNAPPVNAGSNPNGEISDPSSKALCPKRRRRRHKVRRLA